MGLAALRRSRALHQQVPPSQLQSRRLRQQSGCRNISTEALTSYRQGSVQDISSRGKRRASGTASKCACKLELAIRDIQRFPGKVPQGTRGLQELAAFLALDLSEDQLSQLAQSTDTALDRAQGRAVQWLRDNLDIDLEGIGMDILLIVAQLTFSLWYVIGKDALTDGVDPLTFAMVREALASVMLWVVALTFEGPFRLQKPGDARRFGLLGLLCCLNVCGFLKGLSYVSDLQASIMQPFTPVVVMAICAAMGIEQLSNKTKLGVALSTAGAIGATVAACAAGGGTAAASVGSSPAEVALGSSILAGQILAYSALTVFQRDLSGRYKPLTMTAAYYTIGSLLTLLLDLSAEGFDIARVTQAISVFGPPYDVKLWGALIYAVVVATMFNFSVMSYASAKVSPNTISKYIALQPLFNLILGLGLHQHEANAAEVGAGALIIAGLMLATGEPEEAGASA